MSWKSILTAPRRKYDAPTPEVMEQLSAQKSMLTRLLTRHGGALGEEVLISASDALGMHERTSEEAKAKTQAVAEARWAAYEAAEVRRAKGRANEAQALRELVEEVRSGTRTGDSAVRAVQDVEGTCVSRSQTSPGSELNEVYGELQAMWLEVGRLEVNRKALERHLARSTKALDGLSDDALDELLGDAVLVRARSGGGVLQAPLEPAPGLALVPSLLAGMWSDAQDAVRVGDLREAVLETLVVLASESPRTSLKELKEAASALED
jgi:hypothetical protein